MIKDPFVEPIHELVLQTGMAYIYIVTNDKRQHSTI